MNFIHLKKVLSKTAPDLYMLIFSEFIGTLILNIYFFLNYNSLFLEPLAFTGAFELRLLRYAFELKQPIFLVVLILFAIIKLVTSISILKKKYIMNFIAVVIYSIECIFSMLFIITVRISVSWSTAYFFAECFGWVFNAFIVLLSIYNLTGAIRNKTGDS